MSFNPDQFVGLSVAEFEVYLERVDQTNLATEWASRVDWREPRRFAGATFDDPTSIQSWRLFPKDIGQDLPENHPPILIPNVDLIRYIGGGQFGWVYAGKVRSTGLVVAVKVLRNDPGCDTPRMAANEAINGAKLNHRNIMRVFDLRPVGDYWIILMELVKGDRLSDASLGAVSLKPLLSALSDAVRCMGASKIIHRDLKPDNIVLRQTDGSPVIVDLGISVDLEVFDPASAVIAGTPLFMPPEAIDGVIDIGFDPYSLGVTATMVVTGVAPRLPGSIHDLFGHKRSGRFRQEIVSILGGVDRSIAEWITALVDNHGAQRLAALHAGIS